MHYPSVFTRVRVSGREDDFIVVRVDRSARVVDICPLVDHTAIEKNVPFSSLFAPWGFEATPTPSDIHDCRAAEIRGVLHSSHVMLMRSHAVLADLQNSIRSTARAIDISQQMIVQTDRLIDEAWCGGFIDRHANGSE